MKAPQTQKTLSKACYLGCFVVAATVWLPSDDNSIEYSIPRNLLICVIAFALGLAAGHWNDQVEKEIARADAERRDREYEEWRMEMDSYTEFRAIELYIAEDLPHDLPWHSLSENTRDGYRQRAMREEADDAEARDRR